MLKVININDSKLKMVSEPITDFDENLRTLVREMFETMYATNGIGLAAVQVGVLKRLFIIDIPEKKQNYIMINPVITAYSEEKTCSEEGCLSLPGVLREVNRSKNISVDFYNIDGKKETLKATGLLSICIQHEFDHLNGIMFIDRLAPEEMINAISEFREKSKK